MKSINIILLLLLFTTISFSTVYENGEDKKERRWRPLHSSIPGKIFNEYDSEKKSRVIRVEGEKTKSAYMLITNRGRPWKNSKEFRLSWEMKYSEDFVIIVGVNTNLGKRYLIYTPGTKNGYMQYGLGLRATDGVWKKYSRNLEKDLERFENSNHIETVNIFVIRGSGSIDNVQLSRESNFNNVESGLDREVPKKVVPKKVVPKKVTPKKVPKKVVPKKVLPKKTTPKKVVRQKVVRPKNIKSSQKKREVDRATQKNRRDMERYMAEQQRALAEKLKRINAKRVAENKVPKLYVKGANPLFLKIGQRFVEPGVRAIDKEDGEIDIRSSDDIDIYKPGLYSVIYIARDSLGNVAADARYIRVGEGGGDMGEEQSSPRTSPVNQFINTIEDNQSLDEESEDLLEERELEISAWEKELALREKEILEREKRMQGTPGERGIY